MNHIFAYRRLLFLAAARSLIPTAACEAPHDASNAELKLVQVIFRHGARTPLTDKYWEGVQWTTGEDCREAYKAVQLSLAGADGGPIPESKYDLKQLSTTWPGGCKKGELTAQGQQQSRNLGEWLRLCYVQQIPFLPSNYSEGLISARTTNYARTKETLQGVITGLYSNAGSVRALTSSDADEILIGTTNCSQLNDLLKLQVSRLQKQSKTDEAVQQLHKDICTALNLPDSEHIAYTDLYDSLTARKFHDKGWPPGMTEDLYIRIEKEAFRRMAAVVSLRPSDDLGPDILRLSMGQLFHEMTERMDAAAQGLREGDAKIVLFSGHDTTIMPIVASLVGDKIDRWPPYVANVVIELWHKKGSGHADADHFVKAYYNQEELALQGASAGSPVSLADFKERFWKPYLLSRNEYQEQCKLEMRHGEPAQVAAVGGDSVQGI